MKLTTAQWRRVNAALSSSFGDEEVKWRVGARNKAKTKCLPLAYIDSRAVQNRLDDVVGPGNWETSYRPVSITLDNGDRVTGIECTLTVFGVSRADIGHESSTDPIKGAYSDALKRAAVHFGVGRYLYDVKQGWVDYTGNDYEPFASTAFQKNHWKGNGRPWSLAELRSACPEPSVELPGIPEELADQQEPNPIVRELCGAAVARGDTMKDLVDAAVEMGLGDENDVVARMRQFGQTFGMAETVRGGTRIETPEELAAWAQAIVAPFAG